jgi:uncharacterized secreted protein with C-terminal beta-propeller domain
MCFFHVHVYECEYAKNAASRLCIETAAAANATISRPVSESLKLLNDEEVIMLSQKGKIQAYALEKMLGDYTRAVKIRRALLCSYPSIHCSIH